MSESFSNPEAQKLLTFEEFIKIEDSLPMNSKNYTNFWVHFALGFSSEIYRKKDVYLKFKKENIEFNKILEGLIRGQGGDRFRSLNQFLEAINELLEREKSMTKELKN